MFFVAKKYVGVFLLFIAAFIIIGPTGTLMANDEVYPVAACSEQLDSVVYDILYKELEMQEVQPESEKKVLFSVGDEIEFFHLEQYLDEMVELLESSMPCILHQDISRDDYANILRLFQAALLKWFENEKFYVEYRKGEEFDTDDPEKMLMSLPSDKTSAMITDEQTTTWQDPELAAEEFSPVPDRVHWAIWYNWTKKEIKRINKDWTQSKPPPTSEDQKENKEANQLDLLALLGDIETNLGIANETPDQTKKQQIENSISEKLDELKTAFDNEAKTWISRKKSNNLSDLQWGKKTFSAQAERVTRAVRTIAGAWKDRPNSLLREKLGLPFYDYFKSFYNGGFDDILAFEFDLPLPRDKNLGEPIFKSKTTIPRLLVDLRRYDVLNLRALFTMHTAQYAWGNHLRYGEHRKIHPNILKNSEDKPFNDLDLQFAAGQLQSAINFIDRKPVRLLLTAHLINNLFIPVYIPLAAKGEKAATKPAEKIPVQIYLTGRRLSEFGLCLMNRALLDYPLDSSQNKCEFPAQNQYVDKKCDALPISQDFWIFTNSSPSLSAETSGFPIRISPSIAKAYEKVFAGIFSTSSALEDESPVSSDFTLSLQHRLAKPVQCDLQEIGSAENLTTLSVGLDTYYYFVTKASVGDFELSDYQAGRLLSLGMGLAKSMITAIFDSSASSLTENSFMKYSGFSTIPSFMKSMDEHIIEFSTPDQISDYTRLRNQVCYIADRGQGMYRKALNEPRLGGIPLYQKGKPYIDSDLPYYTDMISNLSNFCNTSEIVMTKVVTTTSTTTITRRPTTTTATTTSTMKSSTTTSSTTSSTHKTTATSTTSPSKTTTTTIPNIIDLKIKGIGDTTIYLFNNFGFPIISRSDKTIRNFSLKAYCNFWLNTDNIITNLNEIENILKMNDSFIKSIIDRNTPIFFIINQEPYLLYPKGKDPYRIRKMKYNKETLTCEEDEDMTIFIIIRRER